MFCRAQRSRHCSIRMHVPGVCQRLKKLIKLASLARGISSSVLSTHLVVTAVSTCRQLAASLIRPSSSLQQISISLQISDGGPSILSFPRLLLCNLYKDSIITHYPYLSMVNLVIGVESFSVPSDRESLATVGSSIRQFQRSMTKCGPRRKKAWTGPWTPGLVDVEKVGVLGLCLEEHWTTGAATRHAQRTACCTRRWEPAGFDPIWYCSAPKCCGPYSPSSVIGLYTNNDKK